MRISERAVIMLVTSLLIPILDIGCVSAHRLREKSAETSTPSAGKVDRKVEQPPLYAIKWKGQTRGYL